MQRANPLPRLKSWRLSQAVNQYSRRRSSRGGLIATIARIELEISALDKQREALKMAVEILRLRSGATPE